MPLVSEKTPRWRNIVGLILLVAAILLLIWVLRQGSSVQSAVNATNDSVERTDCARRVNAEQSKARDEATIADRAASRYLFSVLLSQASGARPTPEEQEQRVVEFSALVQTAEAADRAVADLPDPAQEVDRRCPG